MSGTGIIATSVIDCIKVILQFPFICRSLNFELHLAPDLELDLELDPAPDLELDPALDPAPGLALDLAAGLELNFALGFAHNPF